MIGYNFRTVKLPWLDETVDLYLAGQSEAEIGQILRERRLQDQLSVHGSSTQNAASRGEKTITILLKTWVRVPSKLAGTSVMKDAESTSCAACGVIGTFALCIGNDDGGLSVHGELWPMFWGDYFGCRVLLLPSKYSVE